MKKNTLFVAALLLSISFSQISTAGQKAFTGTIHLRDGRAIKALDISISYFTDTEKARLKINDQNYEIEPEKVVSLDFLELSKSDGWIRDGSVIVVTLKNGRSATATNASFKGYAKVSFLDEFTGERVTQGFYIDGSKDDEDPADIIRIDFTSAGNMKYSKSSNAYFPPSFSFDPYTGELLSAVTPTDSGTGATRESFIETKRTDIDVEMPPKERELTTKALDYAKKMVNPISSKEEINQAFDEFKKAAERTFN